MNKPTRVKPVRRGAAAETTALVPASGALVAMPVPGAELDRAARVNFFHRLSREAGLVAIRAAIAAGVELLEAKAEHAGGFQSWVKAKCTFGLSTAYNYISLAEKTLPASTLPQLLALPEADRETAIEEAATSTDSRTLTDLYTDLGIVKRTPSKMGGARPGAGRPSKSLLDEQVKIDSFFGDDVLANWTDAILVKRWHLRATPKAKEALLAIAGEITSSLGGKKPGKAK